jgi:hypothetical protein
MISSLTFSQTTQPIEVSSSRQAEGSPSFSDRSQYNSYDFCNSPLGLLKRDSVRVKLNLGMRTTSWHEKDNSDSLKQSATSWNIPNIMIGKPGSIYLRLYYSPVNIHDETKTSIDPISTVSQKLSLPLNRFGITVAGQTNSGIFQMAVRGKGYYGEEALSDSKNTRLIMGLEDLSLTLGSHIHELVTIGVNGRATAKLDTLLYKTNPIYRDRYFTGLIPVIGWYIDFGKEGFPVASDFSFELGTHRFVYVTYIDEDRDPIRGDSLAWKWQTIGDIPGGDLVYHPALYLGYWRNHYQRYAPTESNDNLDVGDEVSGQDWKISSFSFGLGTSVDIMKYGKTWLEYKHSTLGLDYGDFWTNSSSKNKGYDRISIGIEANIHSIEALHIPPSTETFLRLGYFNQRENSKINSFESEQFDLVNSVSYNSMRYSYSPDSALGNDQRVMGITIGIGGSFFNKMLTTDAHLAFLSKTSAVDRSGTQFGIDCIYALR